MAVALSWIDIDTANHLVAIENRISETGAIREVAGVAAKIGEVGFKTHRLRPIPIGKARSRSDMFDTSHPGGVIAFVVFGAERLETVAISRKRSRDIKLLWDELGRHNGPG